MDKSSAERREERKRKALERRKRHEDVDDLLGVAASDEQMSQYKQEAQKEDRDNREILRNAIAAAAESETIGQKTAAQLQAQREQLERVDQALADMNAALQRSERILTGLESFGGLLMNKFSRLYPERRNLFRFKKEKKLQPEDFKVPKAVVAGSGLEPVLKHAQTHNRIELQEGEKLLYFVSNSTVPVVVDLTATCVIVTNKRLIQLDGGREITSFELLDVRAVDYVQGSTLPLRHDKITVTLPQEKKEVWIWVTDAGVFIANLLDRMATANGRYGIPKKSQASGSGGPSSGRVVPAASIMDSIGRQLPEGKDKRKELKRIMDTPDAKLSPAEREVKYQLQEEDGLLDMLIDQLGSLERLGEDMGRELEEQADLVDHLDTQVAKATTRVDVGTRRAGKLSKG